MSSKRASASDNVKEVLWLPKRLPRVTHRTSPTPFEEPQKASPLPSPLSPIVVLDSGLGGLTVARAIRQLLPHDDLVYFGDTARVPYGSKSPATVLSFVRQIIQYLQPHHPKQFVIACNTATALCLRQVREEFPSLSITGVIEPGARAAVAAAGDRPRPVIGVIATEATVRSRAYAHAICRRRTHARLVSKPTPLLVPLIEEGREECDPLVRLALRQYLLPVVSQKINVLVLGCTHYPIYAGLIRRMVGPKITVIDSAEQCAQDVLRRLDNAGLLRPLTTRPGTIRCFVTDDSPRFEQLASRFLGFPVETPTWVPLDDLQEPVEPRLRAAV